MKIFRPGVVFGSMRRIASRLSLLAPW